MMRQGRQRALLLGLLGGVGAIAIWYLLATGPLEHAPFPAPLEVSSAIGEELGSVAFWQSLWTTMRIAITGLLLATIFGVVIGVLAGWFKPIGKIISVPVEFFKPIPPLVVMPIAILVLGPTDTMAITLVFYGCVLPMVYQTVLGVREVDPVAIQTSRSYSIPRIDMLIRVVLPFATAFIATALRIAIPMSLMTTVIAGLLGGAPGYGSNIQTAMSANAVPQLFALVVLLGFVGLILQWISESIEGRLLHWHPAYRSSVA